MRLISPSGVAICSQGDLPGVDLLPACQTLPPVAYAAYLEEIMSLMRLAKAIGCGEDILAEAICSDCVDVVKARANSAQQVELWAAELRRRGF
jgi:hypothetical protein